MIIRKSVLVDHIKSKLVQVFMGLLEGVVFLSHQPISRATFIVFAQQFVCLT